MKKINNMIVILLMLMLVLPFAMAKTAVEVAPYPGSPDLFGQNHYYSVVFDEEGDAVVAAKLNIHNTGKENINKIALEIPGQSIRIISILEEVQMYRKNCRNYDQVCIEYDNDKGCVRYEKRCKIWNSYPSGGFQYYTIDYTKNQLSKSATYELELPVALKEQQTATIIIYYKVDGYVKKMFGVYDFDFETIKVNQDVNQIRVSVNVQNDLYLKGGKTSIDYIPSLSVFDSIGETAKAGIESQDLQRFSSSIEYQSGYTKTAQGLDPWESFHVNGKYAESWFMLHKIGFLLGIAMVIVLIGIIFIGFRRLFRSRLMSKKEGILALIGIGSASALIMILNWFFFGFMIKNLRNWVGYQYADMLTLLFVLLAAIITIVLLIGPPVYVGTKSGIRNAFIVVGVTITMLVVLSIVIVLFLAMASHTYPVRMLG